MGNVVMNGGVIESYGVPHVGVFGGGSIIHNGGNYSGGLAPSSIFKIVVAPTYPVQLVGPIQQNMNVPWADNLTWMQSTLVKTNQSCGGTDKVSGISSSGSVVCTADQGGIGYTLTLMNTLANAPANGATYYVGGDIIDYNNTSFDAAKIEIPRTGTIKRIYIRQNVPSGNAGTAENVTHKLCVNSASNCFGTATFNYGGTTTSGSDVTLNVPVTAGDTLALRVDTPNWATRPTNVRWYATVYIE
jgi:hypothetical protein